MEKNIRVDLLIAILIFFIGLFIFTRLAGPIPFTVNNINTNVKDVFQVQGSGSASAAPDTAVISLGVTTEAQTVAQAQEEANEAANKIIDSLKKQGIKEESIKTVNYSVSPNYSFSGESQRIIGYSVSQSFEVEAPIDKASQTVDAATSAGANNIGNISFKLNDDKLADLKNKAREEAVKNAKSSASGLADASGIKLGKIINVSESYGNNQPIPVMLDAREAQGGELENKTNITPGESNIEVTVTLSYQIQ